MSARKVRNKREDLTINCRRIDRTWVQEKFEIKGMFANKVSKDCLSVTVDDVVSVESIIELLLMPNFNCSKPWVKNQGIQPHAERMPPCGCISRLYRRQLVDR